MTSKLIHFGGHLFMTSDGILDANRLLQEIDRERHQCELLRQGRTDISLCMIRKPVEHIEGTRLLDTQTGEVFDIRDKQSYLIALQAESLQLRNELSLRALGDSESFGKAHMVIQQIQLLNDQLDGLLHAPCARLCARIATASIDEIIGLESAIAAFPNDGFYRTELRTALQKRRGQLNITVQHV